MLGAAGGRPCMLLTWMRMRSTWWLLASLAVLPLLACDSSDAVGDSCGEGTCTDNLECRKEFPGGFCAQECEQEGVRGGCPEDTVCATQLGTLLCSPVCDSQDDCRDSYACNGISGTDIKACRIKI
ncbi:hypothetical protein D7V93_09745 [Corallococcus llansteffanensis]|uniref:EGF-like domain-containing protein n=2 Tax=Corallococcus llansteffanensis TaxID=2316731 RepID=A0A3A8Q6V8_9BACT|nr:hypothetical protein D7V93_09745 [Corallococcus llansteffanensis]